METEEYLPIVEAGAEGLVVYQETYDRSIYAELHTAGPKSRFQLATRLCGARLQRRIPTTGHRCALRTGALAGRCNRSGRSFGIPVQTLLAGANQRESAATTSSCGRIPPAIFHERPRIGAISLRFPYRFSAGWNCLKHAGERASLRDALVSLGVTMMSAGSHTEPGGYTRQGSEHLHRTLRGRIVAPDFQDGEDELATGQFEISDERSPAEIASVLRRCGLDPGMEGLGPGACRRMTVSLNGERADARGAATVADLVERYQLPPQSVLIEHNGLALHRHEWTQRTLAEGDRIEFIRVVAGG